MSGAGTDRPGVAGRASGRDAVRGDRGMATVWTAFAACVLCVVFGAVLALGQAVAARHRAGGAADLAALAAADRALWGEEAACAAAARVAGAQGAAVLRCSLRGDIADVTAAVRLGPYTPTVRARAGPPEALPGLPAAVP
ncbi:Rv3654c family TadE-like protein [Streptomyces sp. NPDC059567]|uniref:Rv3654c family TadE-like protein n=1 Tax=Streptomyces sp. NPDC059567 TaxID=3346867 RepID=UPI00368239ED